jgi:2-isopropylmalate synthase
VKLTGEGNGPIAAFVHALQEAGVYLEKVIDFRQHALDSGTEASAIAYIKIMLCNGEQLWGAGIDTNIELAPIKAVLSALNRAA